KVKSFGFDSQWRPGLFDFEMEIEAFILLNRYFENVGMYGTRWVERCEDRNRCALEIDNHFSDLLRKPLSRAKVERNTLPAPIGYLHLQGNGRFGCRNR